MSKVFYEDYLKTFFIIFCYCAVMSILFLSLIRTPLIGWYRGFQSTPLFQVLLWIGALPLIIPFIYLYLSRSKAIKSAMFIGNLRSRIFHYPDCEFQRKISSHFMKYPLNSIDEALDLNFRACNWCCSGIMKQKSR